jgi:molybdopterin synthase sulfur carrier subunit
MGELRHNVWVPAVHRDLTGGKEVLESAGGDVRSVLAALEAQFPGLWGRLVEGDRLRPGIAVSVNGEVSRLGLRQRLDGASEIHILRAAAGGCP